MPKKPRQAHIPRKVARKRKAPRRDAVTVPADAYIDVSGPVHVPDGMSRDPVGPIPMPAGRSRPAYPAVAPRPGSTRAAGQLPTFERAYLIDLVQWMIERGAEVHRVDTPGGYMEIDTEQDLAFAPRWWGAT